MAGKIKPMNQIKQLLQLHKQGESKKAIARILNMSRNTVRAYLNTLATLDKDINTLLRLEAPELEKQFHAGNPAYKDNKYSQLKSRLDYYMQELHKVGVTRQLLWEEYKTDYPDGYQRSQFYHHLAQHKNSKKGTLHLRHEPAEKLFVDFAGKQLSYTNRQTGEVISCPVFVACLPYSDYGFAIALRNQSLEEFIHALTQCLLFLGGSPTILVPDNLKNAVTKADTYEPTINTTLCDFATHYGMTVIPTRTASPQDKALVENHVKLVYSRVYAKIRKQTFFSLAELNHTIADKMLAHNQTRMQNKPWCREERFQAKEQHLLKPLPQKSFEIKYYKTYKVQKNNHIFLGQDHHFYSVPYTYIGQKAKVIYTRSVVRIFIQRECVAVHPRNRTPWAYTTVNAHLCSTHQHYLSRSPGYYLRRAQQCSKELYQFTQQLFNQKKPPEQLYRTCDGMLSLFKKTKPQEFNRACELALAHEKYSYKFIQNMIQNKTVVQDPTVFKDLPDHENIRGKEYYF